MTQPHRDLIDGALARALSQALLSWYERAQRDLPWRHTRDPYRIWVSEIMLQQTQVSTAIPYYERFLKTFPTVRALADAELDEVLALWQGLGYYARARNLHRTAERIVNEHGGTMPGDEKALRALPGIGSYTSAAILSIAFGRDAAAIDGNVVRVLCRLFDYDGDPTRAAAKRQIRAYSETLLPPGSAGVYNQAMMELGATVCLPRDPKCGICPLSRFCLARERGVQLMRPIRHKAPPTPLRHVAAAYCLRGSEILFVRREPQGLLGGLWELPGATIEPQANPPAVLRDYLEQHLGGVTVADVLATISHAYSHFRVRVTAYRVEMIGRPNPTAPWDRALFVPPDDLAAYGLTGVTIKILRALGWDTI